MTITVMERPTPARYNLQYPKHPNGPFGMDVAAVADTRSPFMEPPTVPYIYRLFYTDPISHERIEYRGLTENPTYCDEDMGATDEKTIMQDENLKVEWDEKLEWEMEMCSPFMALARPDTFEGPGVVIMRKCHKPEVSPIVAE